MVKTKLIGAAGRFGARYGQYVRRKIADIERKQRKRQICPFCKGKIKRLSKGIWLCKKCKRKFASHAYFIDEETIKIDNKKVRETEEREDKQTEKKEKKTTKKKIEKIKEKKDSKTKK